MPTLFASDRYSSKHKIFTDTTPYLFNLIGFIALVFLPAFTWAEQQIEQQPQSSDVRVLIDVSGSMKKNDPNNLRLPALRLLIGLLPPDSSAAVWNFGTNAEPLVSLGLANDKWKNMARQSSNKIHSRDLFTNIGVALEAAIADWGDTPSKLNQRSIILLTDGMIDISKDPQKNTQERTRILTEVLKKIEATGANVHTIALSKNADQDFLKQLSTKTDGGFEQTDNAKQLERIFLRLFEKTTKRDTVPLVNNTFLVDDSILELTLLVFKPEKARPTEIIEPSKKQYSRDNKPDYVKWQSEKNYDLITISKPAMGEWSINAETDPDNRVMVVTNLQVQTNRMPNNLFAGETLNISLFMTDNNKKITDDNFLQFISMSASQKEPNQKRWFLHDNGLRGDQEAHDGIYNVGVRETLELGTNKFTLLASSDTFQREINHTVIIHDVELIQTRVDQTQHNNTNYHQIFVTPNLEFINAANVQLSAKLLDEDDIGEPIDLTQNTPGLLEWSYESDSLNTDKQYHIIVSMQTRARSGRPIDYTSAPIPLTLPKFENLLLTPDQLIKEEPEPALEEPPIEEPIIEEPEEVEEKDSGWLIGIIIAVIFNVILSVGGWFGYRRWKKNRDAALEELTGELE